jgi:zinc protease
MGCMRKTLAILFICAALSPNLLQAQAPTVDEVLQRYVSALGGKANLEKIHTMVLRGTIELPELKANGTTAEYFKSPIHFAAISNITGHGTTKFVYDGHEGWQMGPKSGSSKISGAPLVDMARRADIHWELKLREFYPHLQFKGTESVNGEDAWKLEAAEEDGIYDFFFGARTGLLVRFDTGQSIPGETSSVSISDYRRVGAVLFSYGAAQTAGPVKWIRKLTEVKFNSPIDESVFEKPKAPPSTQEKPKGAA